MECSSNEELRELIIEAKPHARNGKVATYIPELANANPDDLSVAVYQAEGNCFFAGDIEKTFTLQSISKVLTLAMALMDKGKDYVFERVGMEPTGDPFNSIVKLETAKPGKPLNPMINAGALAVTSMIEGTTTKDKLERILDFVRSLCDDPELDYCNKVAESEFHTANLNRSLVYFMKEHGIISADVEELIELYTKHCAIQLNCRNLARIGAVFALDGKDPDNGIQLIPKHVAKICKTFMVTCGMYNASGEFAIKVGIPAKSGVSGGILGVVPERGGIGVYGPSLDEKGNSIAGIKLLEMMAKQYHLSIFL